MAREKRKAEKNARNQWSQRDQEQILAATSTLVKKSDPPKKNHRPPTPIDPTKVDSQFKVSAVPLFTLSKGNASQVVTRSSSQSSLKKPGSPKKPQESNLIKLHQIPKRKHDPTPMQTRQREKEEVERAIKIARSPAGNTRSHSRALSDDTEVNFSPMKFRAEKRAEKLSESPKVKDMPKENIINKDVQQENEVRIAKK